MSDLEFSASDSEPVSDVNPEDMARLMADIDQMDDDLFKSGLKSSGGGSGGAGAASKEGSKKVTFRESSKTCGEPAKLSDDDDDDWDADDLLYSDEDSRPQKPWPKPAKPSGTSSPGRGGIASAEKIGVKPGQPPIISKNPETKKSPNSVTPKRDKSKLMDELFGGEDDSKPSKPSPVKEKVGMERKTEAKQTRGRGKDEVTFDDDGDDLLGDLGDVPKKVSSSPKGDNFLSSLLVKSPSVAVTKREKPADFALDEKYKNLGKSEGENKDSLGSYMPSAKATSPCRRSPGKPSSGNNADSDLFYSEPRKHNPHSTSHKKPFDLDDDDILGNLRSRRSVRKELAQPELASEAKKPSPTKAGKKDDWLFGSPEKPVSDTKKTSENTTPTSGKQENKTSEKGDSLGSLLLSDKKTYKTEDSPLGASSEDSANLRHQSSGASPGCPGSSPSFGQPPTAVTEASLSGPVANVARPGTRVANEVHSAPSIGRTPQVDALNQLMHQSRGEGVGVVMAAQEQQQQQQQLELQMTQQLQQQQQLMAEVMKKQMEATEKRYQENLLALQQQQLAHTTPVITTLAPTSITPPDSTKSLEVELKTSEMEIARLKAELEMVRRQHTEEVAMLEDAHKRKLEVELEVWGRVESRLREERDGLVTDFHAKVASLQEEKERMGSWYESQLAGVRAEWEGALERTKELYASMVTRMKEEHEAALERLTHLKELELKGALSASGHVREAEAVMTQLESNTSNLSQLTVAVNTQHDSALEMTQRALKLKEKQLQDSENELAASRAEMESERARLNTLIQRLESALTLQGSETEKERWRLAQEKMKLEVERHSLSEERKHLMLSTETERQSLASARESLMSEHRSLLQSVAHQRQDLATKQAKINAWERQSSATGFKEDRMGILDIDNGVGVVREEQWLRERLAAAARQQAHLKEEEARLDHLSVQLEQEKTKVRLEKEIVSKEQAALTKTQIEVQRVREELERDRAEQQHRLAQITAQTCVLHAQQEKIDVEQQRLHEIREDVVQLTQKGLCVRCQISGGSREVVGASWHTSITTRLPGDGGEGITATSFSHGPAGKVDMSPASVLARLAAARQHQNAEREKRLLQISALESL